MLSCITGLTAAEMRWGLGKHIDDVKIPKNEITYHYYMDLWIDMWLYTFAVGLSKFVILGFYWRMFSTSIIRQPIRILFACSVVWIITRVGSSPATSNAVLTCPGHDDLPTMPTHPHVLDPRRPYQMPPTCHVVPLRSRHTTLRPRGCDPDLPAHRNPEAASTNVKEARRSWHVHFRLLGVLLGYG
jgi:hypothetical protein